MIIEEIKLRKMTANRGMVLTNGEAYSSIGGSVYLAKNDRPENWHEITEAEYQTILAEQDRIAQEGGV
jgi:hypothetical protein